MNNKHILLNNDNKLKKGVGNPLLFSRHAFIFIHRNKSSLFFSTLVWILKYQSTPQNQRTLQNPHFPIDYLIKFKLYST